MRDNKKIHPSYRSGVSKNHNPLGGNRVFLVVRLPEFPMLFSYPNVWKTCPFLLRDRGYRLFLLGPDDPALQSQRTWNAEKAGNKLRANNPIEPLGLATIHEYHEPSSDNPYWRRVDCPNIVGQLEADWQSRLAEVTETDLESR